VARVTEGHWKLRTSLRVLLVFYSNYVPILHRFWDIARRWSKTANLNLPNWPPLFDARRWWPRWNFAEISGVRNLESLGYRVTFFAILSLSAWYRAGLWQTDWRTDRHDDSI